MTLHARASRFGPAPLVALLALLALLSTGCETARERFSSGFESGAVVSWCEDWARLRHAGLLYENNVWNHATVRRENRRQCLLERVVGGKVQYGWSWQWPRGSGEVKAYPQVVFGHKPWLPASTTSSLPRRISAIDELSVAYRVDMRAGGRYNLAFDIWVTNSDRPTPSAITHEIMIWVGDRVRAWEPSPGNRVKGVTIGDAAYDLYIRPRAEWLREHGAPNVAYIAFNARRARLEGTIDLKDFLDYLTENRHVPADAYVASVELGNEVMRGSGEVWLERYGISVN